MATRGKLEAVIAKVFNVPTDRVVVGMCEHGNSNGDISVDVDDPARVAELRAVPSVRLDSRNVLVHCVHAQV